MGALQTRADFNLSVELSLDQQSHLFKSLLEGKSIKSACRELNIPYNHVFDFAIKDPLFHKRMQQIREYATHLQVDDLLNITEGCTTMAEVQKARVQSDNIKWSAGKLVPDKYADNINVNVNHTLDLSSILLAAENRVLPLLQASIIPTITKTDLATLDVAPQSTIVDVDSVRVEENQRIDAIVTIEDLF